MPKRAFPAAVRMRKRREIREVFSIGTYLPLGPLGVRYLVTIRQTSRFLISVKKNVGHAPMRNRIKRLLREGLRYRRSRLTESHDICLFVTRTPKHPLQYDYVAGLIGKLFNELNHAPGSDSKDPLSKAC